MAAALAARKSGIQDILILETDPYLGVYFGNASTPGSDSKPLGRT